MSFQRGTISRSCDDALDRGIGGVERLLAVAVVARRSASRCWLTMTTAAPSAVSSIIAISAMISAVPSSCGEPSAEPVHHRHFTASGSGCAASPRTRRCSRGPAGRSPRAPPGFVNSSVFAPRNAAAATCTRSVTRTLRTRSRSASNWFEPPPQRSPPAVGQHRRREPGERAVIGREHRQILVSSGRVVETVGLAQRRLGLRRRIRIAEVLERQIDDVVDERHVRSRRRCSASADAVSSPGHVRSLFSGTSSRCCAGPA